MDINKTDTAVVFIDPQNDVLSDKGLAWALVGESVRQNNTIENMERIFRTVKEQGFEVFISPHDFSPPIGDGSSTVPSKPTRPRRSCRQTMC